MCKQCPAFFTDVERRAIVDAAQNAELKVLRLMNENSAAALVYGLPKSDLPEEAPINVVIVDVGHAHTQVSAVAFVKGKLSMLASSYDTTLGGRDFDELLVKHFNKEFSEKNKVDVMGGTTRAHRKGLLRLRSGCEKLKKTLSANPKGNVTVECIMDDKDVSGTIEREVFEKLAEDLVEKLKVPLKKVMADSGLTFDKVSTVELMGSSTRMPCIIKTIADFFGQEPKRTLDSAECIGKGCALQAAMLSPQFRVRSFEINDATPFAVSLSWQPTKEDDSSAEKQPNSSVIFTKNNLVPSVKMLTFHRSEGFELTAEYHEDSGLAPEKRFIGKFTISDIPKTKDGGPAKIKVKVGLNLHGVVYVESAQMIEEYEVEEMVPVKEVEKVAVEKQEEKAADAAPAENGTAAEEGGEKMDTDAPKENGTEAKEEEKPAEPKMEKKIKKKTNRVDLKVTQQVACMTKRELDDALEQECQMAVTDRVIIETAEAKNSVETYVYDFRDKLSASLAEFVVQAKKEELQGLLQKTEDWLYEDGDDLPKAEYVKKLAELKALGDPIERRSIEANARPGALEALRSTIAVHMPSRNSSLACPHGYTSVSALSSCI